LIAIIGATTNIQNNTTFSPVIYDVKNIFMQIKMYFRDICCSNV